MRLSALTCSLILLFGCTQSKSSDDPAQKCFDGQGTSIPCPAPKVYRFNLGNGMIGQCKKLDSQECGATLSHCVNNHEYHCLHALDVELVAADSPLPAPAPQPAPPPPAQAPGK